MSVGKMTDEEVSNLMKGLTDYLALNNYSCEDLKEREMREHLRRLGAYDTQKALTFEELNNYPHKTFDDDNRSVREVGDCDYLLKVNKLSSLPVTHEEQCKLSDPFSNETHFSNKVRGLMDKKELELFESMIPELKHLREDK